MKQKKSLEYRVNELEKNLLKLNMESKTKSKLPKAILTSVLVIDKLWRIIKQYCIE